MSSNEFRDKKPCGFQHELISVSLKSGVKEIKKIQKKYLGFTLVELVIVIAIVIVLSVVSVPIYRSYVNKAKMAEGYAVLGAVLSAQKIYFSKYGYFLASNSSKGWTQYEPLLDIDVRANKYFRLVSIGGDVNKGINPKKYFWAGVIVPEELLDPKKGNVMYMVYDLAQLDKTEKNVLTIEYK